MFRKIRQYKKILWVSILMLLVLSVYLYQEFRPTVIFHSPNEYEYLGKVVCTYSGEQDKLYIKDYVAIYRIPYTYNWNEEDEIAIFMRNYGDVLKKEDINFWRLDVFLDENGHYKKHTIKKYFWQKNQEQD